MQASLLVLTALAALPLVPAEPQSPCAWPTSDPTAALVFTCDDEVLVTPPAEPQTAVADLEDEDTGDARRRFAAPLFRADAGPAHVAELPPPAPAWRAFPGEKTVFPPHALRLIPRARAQLPPASAN